MSESFKSALRELGYDWLDAPLTPLLPDWEAFPIVRAIRQVEKNTGELYQNCGFDNVFECQHCEYWDVIDADDCRWHMDAEYVRDGDTDEQYGLYICPDCKTEGWSKIVVAWDDF